MSAYEEKVEASLAQRGVDYRYEEEILDYIKPPVPPKKATYNPDFDFVTEKGNRVYIEAKGRFTPADRRKMVLVKEQHPDKDIRFIFMRDNPIQTGSKTKYSHWAEKNGFKWAVSATGHVPDSWIRGDA
jgi:hypothetical protein